MSTIAINISSSSTFTEILQKIFLHICIVSTLSDCKHDIVLCNQFSSESDNNLSEKQNSFILSVMIYLSNQETERLANFNVETILVKTLYNL